MDNQKRQLHYFGKECVEPERIQCHAGPLAVEFTDGYLHRITYHGKEVIRRIYMAVRNRNWDTLPNEIQSRQIDNGPDHFAITYAARSYDGDIDLLWHATITGTADGTVRFEFAGQAQKAFSANRIGLCILHPLELMETPCQYQEVGTEDIQHGAFPRWISPHQPFLNLKRFSHQLAPGLWARLDYEGETFEMEDQRNWTDASFKTYCPPISQPTPLVIQPGQTIQHSVQLSLEREPGTSVAVTAPQAQGVPTISIGERTSERLCQIGFCINDLVHTPEQAPALSLLKELTPSHVRLDLNLDQPDWADTFARSSKLINPLDVPLWVFCKTAQGTLPDQLGDLLAQQTTTLTAVLLTPNCPPWVPSTELLQQLRTQLTAAGLAAVQIGGGTESNFTEVNRHRPAMEHLDFLFYAATPQVHLTDNDNVIENLTGQTQTVLSARQFTANRPVIVSPVSLKIRFRNRKLLPIPERFLNDPYPRVDPRQWGLFGAAWTMASVGALSAGGAAAVTYYELTGKHGLLTAQTDFLPDVYHKDGALQYYPVYHVLRTLATDQGNPLYAAASDQPFTVQALAYQADAGMIAYVVNLTSQAQDASVVGFPSAEVRGSLLSETDWEGIIADPAWQWCQIQLAPQPDGRIVLHLPPYAIARLATA